MSKIILKGNPLSTQSIYGQSGRIRYMKLNAKRLKANYIGQVIEQWRDKKCIDYPI